jgi:UDPglucose 6-dehydrogenase
VKITVFGEGHLADATRTCCAEVGLEITYYRPDCDLLWFCMDMPVDENDQCLLDEVQRRLSIIMGDVNPKTPILISTQLPIGTMAKWEERWPEHQLFYQPENIRKAHAVEDFRHQERMILGYPIHRYIPTSVRRVLYKFTDNIIEMPNEAAEMTKHVLNAWLAMNITFANEIRDLCRFFYQEYGYEMEPLTVMNGVRTDKRVGKDAPLMPGGPYQGGTLGRDIRTLLDQHPTTLIEAIDKSNKERINESN